MRSTYVFLKIDFFPNQAIRRSQVLETSQSTLKKDRGLPSGLENKATRSGTRELNYFEGTGHDAIVGDEGKEDKF